jgi:hypothetical protein
MADPNPSSTPVMVAANLSSPLDIDTYTPLPQRQPTMPRATLTPAHTDGRDLFGSDASASLPIIPNSSSTNNLPILRAPASLPAPATSPLCIRDVQIAHHIDFKVSTTGAHLSRWRQILTFLFTMYKVVDHVIEGAAPAAPSDDWLADDIHISLWFMANLSDDLLRLVQGSDGRACSTWTKLHNFFYANRSSQYLYLSQLFRTTPRGDMTIAVYAARLQTIADGLANIGYPVANHDLTMQFLAGLGKKFTLPRSVISNRGALPSFSDTLSRLLLAKVEKFFH